MDQRSEKSGAVKPILFNTDMVRVTLEGVKTETRRLVKPIPPENARLELVGDRRHAMDLSIEIPGPNDRRIYTPPYLPGDTLYVRETFACDGFDGEEYVYVYRADVDECDRLVWGDIEENEWAPSSDYHWHPSIHMPKEAARIFLRATDLRVERLQEITDEGAEHEGICGYYVGMGESAYSRYSNWNEAKNHLYDFPRGAFADLWARTLKPTDIGKYGWAANPWVWVISFKRCEKPEGWPWSE